MLSLYSEQGCVSACGHQLTWRALNLNNFKNKNSTLILDSLHGALCTSLLGLVRGFASDDFQRDFTKIHRYKRRDRRRRCFLFVVPNTSVIVWNRSCPQPCGRTVKHLVIEFFFVRSHTHNLCIYIQNAMMAKFETTATTATELTTRCPKNKTLFVNIAGRWWWWLSRGWNSDNTLSIISASAVMACIPTLIDDSSRLPEAMMSTRWRSWV